MLALPRVQAQVLLMCFQYLSGEIFLNRDIIQAKNLARKTIFFLLFLHNYAICHDNSYMVKGFYVNYDLTLYTKFL